jgi:crossover junction endodeoxyribonuclease RuvC
MVIIGFDPGLTNTGYAVLIKKSNEITMVECGLISPKKGKEVSERLYTIFFETNNLIKKFKPELKQIGKTGLPRISYEFKLSRRLKKKL